MLKKRQNLPANLKVLILMEYSSITMINFLFNKGKDEVEKTTTEKAKINTAKKEKIVQKTKINENSVKPIFMWERSRKHIFDGLLLIKGGLLLYHF